MIGEEAQNNIGLIAARLQRKATRSVNHTFTHPDISEISSPARTWS